jgi:hypothetical protein
VERAITIIPLIHTIVQLETIPVARNRTKIDTWLTAGSFYSLQSKFSAGTKTELRWMPVPPRSPGGPWLPIDCSVRAGGKERKCLLQRRNIDLLGTKGLECTIEAMRDSIAVQAMYSSNLRAAVTLQPVRHNLSLVVGQTRERGFDRGFRTGLR